MRTHAPSDTHSTAQAGTRPTRALQRECACGGTSGPSGECAECRRKRLARKRLQPKLRIGAPNDRYEREADRVAEHVMRAPADAAPLAAPLRVQRLRDDAEEGGAGMEAPASVDAVLASPGRPLDDGTRSVMEARMGHDFSGVRVHTDARAATTARAVGARAYTVGRNVVFGAGEYRPGTEEGRRLLAHELVHTLQQGSTERRVSRATTRGAGGCGPPEEVDEDNDGAKRAGAVAHTQIQSFLISSGVLAEVPIPRATKRRMDNQGCQGPSVSLGFADLFKLGAVSSIGEIKPIGSAERYGIPQAEHYVRRSRQSMDRTVGSGACGAQPAGADDDAFANVLGRSASGLPRTRFTKMRGILPSDTVIGPFDGDRDRTLKAKLQAPGAVGYWCTGGASETLPCDANSTAVDAYIERILSSAQDVANRFIDERILQRVNSSLDSLNFGDLLRLANAELAGGARQFVSDALGIPLSLVPTLTPETIDEIAQLIEARLGGVARSMARVLLQRLKNLILGELRIQLRRALRGILRRLIAAICVGVPVVTLAHLLNELEAALENEIRQLMPQVLDAVLVQIAMAVAEAIAQAIAEVLSTIGEILLQVLAVIGVILLALAFVALVVGAVILVFDPVPGDEVALGAAAAFVARLIQQLAPIAAGGGLRLLPH